MSTTNPSPPIPPPDLQPWQVHPSLTEDRLQAIDRLIRQARHEAVLLHEPSKGDTPWVLGCRAFQWVCHRIAQASFGVYSDWLRIVEGGEKIEDTDEFVLRLHFVFAIGAVPIRFYRGIPENVPTRYLRCHHPELTAYQILLEFCEAPEVDDVFRIAVETDDLGEVERTVLVQVAKGTGEPHRAWPIEPPGTKGTITQFTPKREEERELERPAVHRRDRKEKRPTEQEPSE